MKLLRSMIVIALATTMANVAFADEKIRTTEGVTTFKTFKPSSVRAEVGTLGYGGAISYNVNEKVGLTLGYNGGDISWSEGANLHSIDYDMDMSNNNVYLNAELRPFANAFYVAAGVGYIDAEYSLSRTSEGSGSIKIDGKDYYGQNGKFSGKATYDNTFAPYVGLGFSPSTTSRFGVFGEVGAYYTGNPTAEFTATGLTASDGEDGAAAAARETDNFENGSKYQWLPVAKLGVTYRF